jgi:hypothetical protein
LLPIQFQCWLTKVLKDHDHLNYHQSPQVRHENEIFLGDVEEDSHDLEMGKGTSATGVLVCLSFKNPSTPPRQCTPSSGHLLEDEAAEITMRKENRSGGRAGQGQRN